MATALVIKVTGITTTIMGDLHRLRISTITTTEEFVSRVGANLAGFAGPEFEEWDEATARIVGCVQNIISKANGNSVVMVTCGRILTVLFSHIMKRRL